VLLSLVVVVALVAAGAQWRFDALGKAGRNLGLIEADTPAEIAAPVGLKLPEQTLARPVAAALDSGAPSAQKITRALKKILPEKALGSHVGMLVATLDGQTLFRRGSAAMTPASTTKLLTSTAALHALGPMATFTTSTRLVPGTHRVVLVGGGDPYLASTAKEARGLPAPATTAKLAAQTARALQAKGIKEVRLRYDDHLFTGPAVSPTWPSTYLPENVVPPISALWVDEAKGSSGYVSDPAADAAGVFADQLRSHGIRVLGRTSDVVTPDGASRLAKVSSAPLGQIVQHLLDVSDNNAAEVVARHVGAKVDDDASFAGATKAVTSTLDKIGVDTDHLKLYDGSGLSRRNRITPRTLVDVLRLAAGPGRPELRDVVTGLPVAGFTGSLAGRYVEAPHAGLGRVRAKTGTLTGVSALAGIAVDLDGDQVVFAFMADKIRPEDTLKARAALDALTATLGACACGTGTAP
jgi:D-alanyl-D-alanine carboxypeptidase/D-alanyl-D-alanine-endopeptidase (penicillin-binding protein 4)